jgi:hypothetical protein
MKLVRCDSCGHTIEIPDGHKPPDWWQRRDAETHQESHACCRECRDKLPGTPIPI